MNKSVLFCIFLRDTRWARLYRLDWRIYRSCSTFSKIVNKGKSPFTEVADSRVGDFLSSNTLYMYTSKNVDYTV